MKVIRARDRLTGDITSPTGRFRGHSLQHLLLEAVEPARASFVRFDQDAHTQWHTHSGGQLIHVVEGKARIQVWGQAMETLRPGDTAVAQPGEKHWHGAIGDAGMTQLALSSGQITWLEDVDV